MESTAPRVDEIDIVEVYHKTISGKLLKADQNISVLYPGEGDAEEAEHEGEQEGEQEGEHDNGSNQQNVGGVAGAVMRYYYNFHPYVVHAAKDEPFYLDNEPAGTLLNPNVELLLAHSQPAPFGKGEETVFDESVRRAKSIPGNRLTKKYGTSLDRLRSAVKALARKVHTGHVVRLELSKLHIYEEGGHFHPHRDTLRSEDHVGSIVVLLGTPFTGGEFFINGEHCPLEIDRAAKRKIPLVAFYTDIVHEVRPVTSGVRVSLQFDVFANMKNEITNDLECLQECVSDFAAGTPFVDEERCDAVVTEISARLSSTPNLIIPTYHRYPQPALHRNTLKPIDEMLARKLIDQGYSVTPVPLSLVGEQCESEHNAWASLFWQSPFNEGKVRRAPVGTEFVILPRMEGLNVFAQEELEFTGNEAQVGMYAYYLSGLLISLKAAEEQIAPPTKRARASDDKEASNEGSDSDEDEGKPYGW